MRPSVLLVLAFLMLARAADAQTPLRIMPLGDSITQGVNDTVPPTGPVGYRGTLWTQLLTDGFNVNFVGSLVDGPSTIDRDHEGHGGFRIDQILTAIDGYLAAASPDIILLHIGTNDLLQGASPDLAAQRLAALLDRIHQDRPTAQVIVASIIPVRSPNAFNVDPQLFAQYVARIPALVGDRAALGWRISHVDMATLAALTSSEYDSVGIHPTDSGYAKMAAVWHAELAAILDGDAPPTIGATSPFDTATVSGTVTLSANAFDDVGVADVSFAVDGNPIVDDLNAPYQTVWNSASVAAGPHTLAVTARDTHGQTRTELVRFTVVNNLADPALVAAFGFEESGATVVDSSGRNNHGMLVGASRTALGHSGSGVEFDGNTGRVEITAPAADLRFTTAATITVWVYPITLPSGWHMIASRQLGGGGNDSWWLGHNGTTLFFGSLTATLTAGTWTHVAAVKNGASEQIYLNGALAASTSSGAPSFNADANEVGIGAASNGLPLWGEVFDGRLDDLRFYASARTAGQIQTDMATPIGGAPDQTPPAITNIGAAPSNTSAAITWTTDEPSTSQVDFGTTAGYGTTTTLDSNLVTSHSVSLSGLSPNTLYHFRVRSGDVSQNVQTSGDATFTTTSSASTLVAAYGFDAGSGATAADQSGRGNTLALTGTIWSAQGHSGGALQFNGTSSRAELLSPAADLAFTTTLTISAWVNATALPTGWHMIASRQFGTGAGDSWWLGHNGTTLYFGSVTAALTAGVWTHVAAVKNGTTEQIYINGTLAASSAGGVASFPSDANEVGVGAGNNGTPSWGEVFDGRLDDLRFYAEARNASQIQADMLTPVGGTSDTQPPVINNIGATATTTAATITWTTDEPSTSQVDFGTTAGYGSTTALDSTLVTSHSVPLSGLSPNTLYHFRVRSGDANQNVQTSGDQTFSTTSGTATLVAAFGFEEASGTTAVDSAGNDNPGTLVSGVTRTAVSRYGRGLAFDGVDDEVSVADAASLNAGTGPFTVGLWVRTTGTALQRVIGKRANCNVATAFWDLQLLGSGVVAGEIGDNTAGTYIGIVGTHVVNDGAWHYLTLMRNGASLQLYVDGALDVGGTAAAAANVSNTSPVRMGNLCGDGPFSGELDEVRYYNGTLSASELQAAMGSGIVGTSTLMAAYNFDAGSGTTVADRSGRGNTLTLTSTSWSTSGHTNSALQFNGTSSRAELPPPAADLGFTTSMTITVWVNPTTLSNGWHTIVGRQLGNNHGDSWWLGHNRTTLYFGSLTATLTAGTWTHIAVVKNGPIEQIYLNGALVASTASGGTSLTTDANEVGIGAGNNGNPSWAEFFAGRLDDLRFYAEARTAAQIQTDMTTPVQ
jgi:lysophospholipase L1-like esterase